MGLNKFIMIAVALMTFGSPAFAKTLTVEISFVAAVQRIIGSDGAPYIMNGDRVTGEFGFDVGNDSVISNVSGFFAVQGVVGQIIGVAPWEQRNSAVGLEVSSATFLTTQIGEGAGNGEFDLSRFVIEFGSDLFETPDFFFAPINLFTAGDTFLWNVNALGQRRSRFDDDATSTSFSNNFLRFEEARVTVSAVPLPAALPMLLAALAGLVAVRTRRRAGHATAGAPVLS